MAAGLGIIVYFTINRPVSHETPLAKQKDFLNGKRSQNSLCAPAYKAEIKRLNSGEIINKLPKLRNEFEKSGYWIREKNLN